MGSREVIALAVSAGLCGAESLAFPILGSFAKPAPLSVAPAYGGVILVRSNVSEAAWDLLGPWNALGSPTNSILSSVSPAADQINLIGSGFTLIGLGFKVGKARKEFNVPLPQMRETGQLHRPSAPWDGHSPTRPHSALAERAPPRTFPGRDVDLPHCRFSRRYASGDNENAVNFNCVQRGHQQALETYPMFLALSIIGGIKHPICTALAGLLWIQGRKKARRTCSILIRNCPAGESHSSEIWVPPSPFLSGPRATRRTGRTDATAQCGPASSGAPWRCPRHPRQLRPLNAGMDAGKVELLCPP